MTSEVSYSQIQQLEAEIVALRRRLFGDSRDATSDSMYRMVKETHEDVQELKMESTRLRTWNIFLTIGFVMVVVILVVILYLFLTGG